MSLIEVPNWPPLFDISRTAWYQPMISFASNHEKAEWKQMAVSTMSSVPLLIFRGVPDINLCPKSIICLEPREGRVEADGGIDLVLCPSSRSDSPTSDGSTVPEQPRTGHPHTGNKLKSGLPSKTKKTPDCQQTTLIIFSIRQSSPPLGVIFHQHELARRRVLRAYT